MLISFQYRILSRNCYLIIISSLSLKKETNICQGVLHDRDYTDLGTPIPYPSKYANRMAPLHLLQFGLDAKY